MDSLSNVLSHFSLNANVFFSGNLCGMSDFDEPDEAIGHLHLLKSGKLTVKGQDGFIQVINKPSVMYFPRSTRHSLFADEEVGVDVVCARIKYQEGKNSPLLQALPYFLNFELTESDLLGQSAKWIFDEAFNERNGKQLIIDRLCDIFLINILRQILEQDSIKSGMMAGLAHPQLSKALVQLHDQPEQNWSLETMAETCAMSRSKFADLFKKVIEQTPSDYLTEWRISVAKKLILKNMGMDIVANQVGYENGSAFARVFRKKMGLSPKEWMTAQLNADD